MYKLVKTTIGTRANMYRVKQKFTYPKIKLFIVMSDDSMLTGPN